MENELSHVIDALPAMAWTARDDCTQDERWWLSSSAREHHFRYAVHHEVSVMAKLSLVSVVDDDESVRESLPDLLREFGYAAQAFSSAEEFLASDYLCQTRCLILDVAGRRYRSSSSPPMETKASAHAYSNRAPWNACSNHLAIRLCARRSMPHLERDERRARTLAREGS